MHVEHRCGGLSILIEVEIGEDRPVPEQNAADARPFRRMAQMPGAATHDRDQTSDIRPEVRSPTQDARDVGERAEGDQRKRACLEGSLERLVRRRRSGLNRSVIDRTCRSAINGHLRRPVTDEGRCQTPSGAVGHLEGRVAVDR
jgi:hypothetical protein